MRGSLRVLMIGVSVFQKLLLYHGTKRVDLQNTVDWKQGRLMSDVLSPDQLALVETLGIGANAVRRSAMPAATAATSSRASFG